MFGEVRDSYLDLESFLPGSGLTMDSAPTQESRNPGGSAKEILAERQSFFLSLGPPQMHRPHSQGIQKENQGFCAGAGGNATWWDGRSQEED